MNVKILPSKGNGIFNAPPSKSIAHRFLICAGLCEGESIIENVPFSDDIKATLDCLSAIGAKYEILGNSVKIKGINIRNISDNIILPCRESGSTLRFFIPFCLLFDKEVTFKGSEKLFSRPLSVYEDIFEKQKIAFTRGKDFIKISGLLCSGKYELLGDISSQFVSGLLFALPLMEQDSEIKLISDVESRSYIELTIEALRTFGIEVEQKSETNLYIKGKQSYRAAFVTVEGDYSNSAFFEALNLFGSSIEISGLKEESLQGDKIYKKYFPALENSGEILDISDCPDLGPILFAVTVAKKGGGFVGTRRLRLKESDRACSMAEELSKFGARVTVDENSVNVDSFNFHAPKEPLWGHNDHRIVMACAVLLTLTGGILEGAEACKKSFPNFFDELKKLGFNIETSDRC